MRSLDGRLLRVEPVWVAEAERYNGTVTVAVAEAATADEAWERLLANVVSAKVQVLSRVRIAPAF